MLDGMLNMRIKCCRMIRSAELCPYVANIYSLFIIKLNLIIDLFWKIGFNPLSDEHS